MNKAQLTAALETLTKESDKSAELLMQILFSDDTNEIFEEALVDTLVPVFGEFTVEHWNTWYVLCMKSVFDDGGSCLGVGKEFSATPDDPRTSMWRRLKYTDTKRILVSSILATVMPKLIIADATLDDKLRDSIIKAGGGDLISHEFANVGAKVIGTAILKAFPEEMDRWVDLSIFSLGG